MNTDNGLLLALVGGLLVLTVMIVLPFLQYVLAAILIAYVLYPVQVRLETHVSPMIGALGLVSLTLAGLVVPLSIVFVSAAESINGLVQDGAVDAERIQRLESRLESTTGLEVEVGNLVAGIGENVGMTILERSTDVFGTLTFHLLGVILALFLLYYLLKEGDVLMEWVDRTVDLPEETQSRLYREIDGVMWGVILGHVFVGVIQGLVAGVGFFVVGIPNSMFWTAAMVVMAMVPIVGTVPIWGGGVIYLYLSGEPVLAVGLLVYCVIVVGLTDDYLRPFAVDRYARLNPAVILLGILGGGYAFGVMGLFFGPVILGALKAALSVISDEDLDHDPPATD